MVLVNVLLNICIGVESYIHAYIVDDVFVASWVDDIVVVDGFYIRVDDAFVASRVDDFVVVDGFYIRVDDVFVASWVDNFVIVDGIVSM